MSLRRSLSIIFISTIFSLIIFAGFFFFIDPEKAGILGTIILFLSLFTAISGVFTLLFIIVKFRTIKEKEKIFEKFSSSFRQAIFISLFLFSLFLTHFLKLVNFWSIAALFLFFVLLEIIFSTREKKFTYLKK